MNWQDAIVAILVLTAAGFVVLRVVRLFVNQSPSCCSRGCGRPSTVVQIASSKDNASPSGSDLGRSP